MNVPWTSYRYVGLEFIFSFLVSFAFFFCMFFVNQLLLLAEDILQKDVGLVEVIRLILYSLPSIVALSVPFATLVGALMAVGRLSSDNEIVAFQAGGIARNALFVPIVVVAVVLAGLSFLANDVLLPAGTLQFGRLYRELLYRNPALELEPYSVKRYQDNVLVTGAVGTGLVEDLLIFDTDTQGNRRVIVADKATIDPESDPNVISLALLNVTSHTHAGSREFSYSLASSMVYNILLQDITVALRTPGPREMSARDVQTHIMSKRAALQPRITQHERQVEELRAQIGLAQLLPGAQPPVRALNEFAARSSSRPTDRSLQIYRLEYHKKFSIPFAAVSFVVLAFPLGLFSRRSGRSVGFGIGLLVSTLYWALLIGGQTFGTQRPNVSPVLAMWAPNAFFLLAGVGAFAWRSRR